MSDEDLVRWIHAEMKESMVEMEASKVDESQTFAIVQTVGNLLHPRLSGIPQADVFRPLRLPTILVAGEGPDGIASTLASMASLIIRDYDIDAIICFGNEEKNGISEWLEKDPQSPRIFRIPLVPSFNEDANVEALREGLYHHSTVAAMEEIAGHLMMCRTERLEQRD